ncbi:v-type proton ATPase subunit H [Caerostris extrusa]|uniref:V-type proton ATPase subunit H n=1 Tax=Caerostris extrusa TaxID=172846 RepID=A0AAV4PGB7_CAEEX|nr:v-type proton ATPase subunit H [Caerostris extrusa]
MERGAHLEEVLDGQRRTPQRKQIRSPQDPYRHPAKQQGCHHACIAAHDIGEYIKHYPRGKLIVDRLGGKDALVRLLSHRHPAIKFHTLKTLQVLMLGHHELIRTLRPSPKGYPGILKLVLGYEKYLRR